MNHTPQSWDAGESFEREFELPADLNERLEARAQRENRTISDIVRDALAIYLGSSRQDVQDA